jgi:tryptophanyl-tRNA synthetase
VQHLEMTRDIAAKFNQTYKEVFPLPKEKLNKDAKVPGVDGEKMSKSYGNTIEIFAEGKPLQKTVMSIKTDSKPVGTPLDPQTCNVFSLYSLFASEEEKAELAARYTAGGIGYGDAKKLLLGKIDGYFGPLRDQRRQLAADPNYVDDVLKKGAQKARAVAQQTMELVREAVGMMGRPVG